MKNFAFLLILTFAILPLANGQVLECTQVMSAGTQQALSIVLPEADAKLVDAAWREFMKPYGKVTRVKGTKEYLVSEALIVDVSGATKLNVHAQAEEVAEGIKMVVWFDTGAGFISSEAYPKEYVGAVKFIKDFAHKVKIDQITMELEEQQKTLAKAENSLEKLRRENESLHKIIEDSKKRIAQAEKDIEINLKEQEDAQKMIGSQSAILESVQKKLDEAKKQD